MLDLDERLQPFLAAPRSAAVITDFDGTLAPIVDKPAEAAALPGAVGLLHELAAAYGTVAVVSGRPGDFLAGRLELDDRRRGSRLEAFGLYGLEVVTPAGVVVRPEVEQWRPVVDRAVEAATAEAPDGVIVEHKGLTLTIHVRPAPQHDRWARRWAEDRAAVDGFLLRPARLSYELVPPVPIDKGTVVGHLIRGTTAACFLGDDVGDLAAFDALDRHAADGAAVLRVGVRSEEAPSDLLARADVIVDGPPGALDLLRQLAAAT